MNSTTLESIYLPIVGYHSNALNISETFSPKSSTQVDLRICMIFRVLVSVAHIVVYINYVLFVNMTTAATVAICKRNNRFRH